MILTKVEKEQPTPVSELEPDTPPELVAICERAMAEDPAQRYPSAKELADEVQRFLSGALVQAYRYRFAEHLKRFVKRHKALVATTARFTIILIVVLADKGEVRRGRAAASRSTQDAASSLWQRAPTCDCEPQQPGHAASRHGRIRFGGISVSGGTRDFQFRRIARPKIPKPEVGLLPPQ